MNAIFLLVGGVATLVLGYAFYSRFVAGYLYGLDDSRKTPAHELRDDIDFVPTNRFVLWGHHFTSVAGAAPIVGPAIAVIWGWVPAFIWVTLGTVFFAGVHDFGALWASVRNKGESIGSVTGVMIGPRARALFMVVIFLLLLMVNGAFAVVIAKLLVADPAAVIPVWGAIVVALIIGQALYRFGVGLLWPSIIGITVLYALIFVGQAYPITLPASVFGLSPNAQWIILLFAYAGVASLLPVWMLLQPRDYINGLQLFIALGLLYAATLIGAPTVVAPMLNDALPESTPSIVPLLFVTIACGAISGFHGLVASGTSSKQLEKESDARLVGYGGAVGEGLLALAAIICTVAGFSSTEEWREVYTAFGKGGVTAFVSGGGKILSNGLGLPADLGKTVLSVMAILFAATTMDTGLRLQRYVVQEAGKMMKVPALDNGVVATLVALASCVALSFAGGKEGSGGMIIWPLFGTTNQLLAGLTLAVVSVMIAKRGKSIAFTAIPLVFLLAMSVFALVIQLQKFVMDGNWFLVVLDIVILVAASWVAVEAGLVLMKGPKEVTTDA